MHVESAARFRINVHLYRMSSVLTGLKLATRDCHHRLENRLGVLSSDFSLHDYRTLIAGLHGYYQPLEALLIGLPRLTDQLPDLNGRFKSRWLEADLKAVGMSADEISQIPICAELPQVSGIAQAFGCLYVLEGATLGGQILSRHFKQTLSIDQESGLRFFSSYGAETPISWHRFGMFLQAAVCDAESEAKAIMAARTTFITLEAWLDRCNALQRVFV